MNVLSDTDRTLVVQVFADQSLKNNIQLMKPVNVYLPKDLKYHKILTAMRKHACGHIHLCYTINIIKLAVCLLIYVLHRPSVDTVRNRILSNLICNIPKKQELTNVTRRLKKSLLFIQVI